MRTLANRYRYPHPSPTTKKTNLIDRLIKQASHIKHAESHGVRMMTFDNTDELQKIKAYCPDAQLVLRILTDDSKSLCKLGTKFGARLDRVGELLGLAKRLELDVIGIRCVYCMTYVDLLLIG